MAVCEIWDVKGRLDHPIDYAENPEKTANPKYSKADLQAMGDVMKYATNGDKTEQQFFVTGVNRDPATARDEMMIAKHQWNDESEIVCYHGFQSFKAGEVTPEQAHEVGVKLAEKMWGGRFQVIVATHLNTECLHNHFVVNSVSYVDGKHYHDNKKNLRLLRKRSDELCREYSLSVIEHPSGRKKPYALYQAEKNGLPTRDTVARQAVDEAISKSFTLKDFDRQLAEMGYHIPAFVLEYATIFLLSFSDELKKLDDTKTNTFCFLLAPSAKMDVDTVELFRPNGETQGLLQITIPYSLLYNPNRLLPALCHELAHYMGERFRMREERYYFFLDCVACELMKYCFDNVISNREKFLKYLALDFLDNTLKCNYEIETGESCEDVYRQPLLDIAERVCRIADELKIIEAYAELARDYVLSDYCGAQFFGLSERELVSQLPLFANRISDLRISFRETYADICMLHFLELSAIDYLEVALPKMGELNTGIYLRIYISLSTAEHSLMDIQTAVQKWGELYTIDAEEINRAHNELKVIADLIESGEICSERYLADYIKKCWSELNKERSGDGKGAHTVKEIYSKILELNNTTDYQDILNIIDYGRQVTFALLEEM